MKRPYATCTLTLALILACIWLGACGGTESVPTPTGQPTAPPERASSTGAVEPAPSASPAPAESSEPAASGPQSAVGTLTAKLGGLEFDDFLEVSWKELSLRDPETVLADGLADVYGLEGAELTDISDAYIRENFELYRVVLEALRQYDRVALTSDQQLSYHLYEWYLDDQLRREEFIYYDYPATFFPVTAVHEQLTYFFTDLHPLASKQDAQDYVARLEVVGTKFEQLLEGLRLREDAGVIPPRFANQWALYGVSNLARSDATATPFYQGFEEKLSALGLPGAEKQALLDSAEAAINEVVLPAFQSLADYLQHLESIAPSDDGLWQFPRGDEYYAYLLRHYTTTGMTADEIHELGKQDLERIHGEMRTIFDDLGYPQDETLGELFRRAAADGGLISGPDVIATYETIIDEANQNLDAAFDIRPQADLVVVQSPIKGMYVSGAMDGSRPGAFHAGPGDTQEAYYAMATLAYHEAIPGHHLQIALAQESDLPSFRNSVSFLGYTEGWALYAEQLASELGWYTGDPFGDLGRLQAEAFRAARLVVDTGIHAKGWTFDQALDYFVENTGFESGGPVDPSIQIARYIVWPGQSTAYKIGMMQMLELRQKAVDGLGDQFDLKAFHNVVLSNGSMPLELLERVVDSHIEKELVQ
jgi:uncharacterized protein (DUF885 family)